MDLNAVLAELQRRKAQLGQRVSDLFTPAQDSNSNFNISGYPTLEQTPSSDQLKAYAAQVAREYAQRAAEGIVPAPIRAREQAMRTDPSAAARPFTSQEVQQSVPYITAAAPIAYHGSPHEFTQFDASKIGTGQGAQSYGHGLYFAENPEVAKSYAHDMKNAMVSYNNPAYGGKHVIFQGDTAVSTHTSADAANKALAKINANNLYQVNIPDEHVAKMLDWDKPLGEQAPEVRKALEPVLNEIMVGPILKKVDPNASAMSTQFVQNMTGAQIHKVLGDKYGYGEKLSEILNATGIPGIKYLDQGSRTAWVEAVGDGTYKVHGVDTAGIGTTVHKFANSEAAHKFVDAHTTRNFVVFDPAILKDVSRQ